MGRNGKKLLVYSKRKKSDASIRKAGSDSDLKVDEPKCILTASGDPEPEPVERARSSNESDFYVQQIKAKYGQASKKITRRSSIAVYFIILKGRKHVKTGRDLNAILATESVPDELGESTLSYSTVHIIFREVAGSKHEEYLRKEAEMLYNLPNGTVIFNLKVSNLRITPENHQAHVDEGRLEYGDKLTHMFDEVYEQSSDLVKLTIGMQKFFDSYAKMVQKHAKEVDALIQETTDKLFKKRKDKERIVDWNSMFSSNSSQMSKIPSFAKSIPIFETKRILHHMAQSQNHVAEVLKKVVSEQKDCSELREKMRQEVYSSQTATEKRYLNDHAEMMKSKAKARTTLNDLFTDKPEVGANNLRKRMSTILPNNIRKLVKSSPSTKDEKTPFDPRKMSSEEFQLLLYKSNPKDVRKKSIDLCNKYFADVRKARSSQESYYIDLKLNLNTLESWDTTNLHSLHTILCTFSELLENDSEMAEANISRFSKSLKSYSAEDDVRNYIKNLLRSRGPAEPVSRDAYDLHISPSKLIFFEYQVQKGQTGGINKGNDSATEQLTKEEVVAKEEKEEGYVKTHDKLLLQKIPKPSLLQVIKNPRCCKYLMAFLKRCWCDENLLFYLDVRDLQKHQFSKEAMVARIIHIYDRYVILQAPDRVNLPSKLFGELRQGIDQLQDMSIEELRKFYGPAQNSLLQLMETDSLNKFLKSEEYSDFLYDLVQHQSK